MRSKAGLTTTLAALVLATSAVAACSGSPAPQAAPPSPTPTATPTPEYLTELPEWARVSSPWLIYPDGFECSGTEGCPNNYRASFGEPGPVLPEGVEYYDPAKHDCVVVQPLGVNCMTGP